MSDNGNAPQITVTFSFASGWSIMKPDSRPIKFPPGGNALPIFEQIAHPREQAELAPLTGTVTPTIAVTPLNVQDVDTATGFTLLAKRADDLANIAQALALAQLEFQDALNNFGQTLARERDAPPIL